MVARREQWTVAEATGAERGSWDRLYRAYGTGAGYPIEDELLSRVWSWISGDVGQTRCLLLHRRSEPEAIGLAHYRPFERPVLGSIGCYVDDLFVVERLRGRGGARALLEHLATLAADQGWSVVRWTTKPSNPAQELYGSLAARSPAITFDMQPRPRD